MNYQRDECSRCSHAFIAVRLYIRQLVSQFLRCRFELSHFLHLSARTFAQFIAKGSPKIFEKNFQIEPLYHIADIQADR